MQNIKTLFRRYVNKSFVVCARYLQKIKLKQRIAWARSIPQIVGNVGNHGNDRKCHKRRQILNQFKRNNELRFGKNLKPKSSKNKIFRGFRVFKYVLLQKNENLEMPEINRKLSKSKKHSVLTVYCYYKTAKKQAVCNLRTILALITEKVTFELHQ